MSDYVDAILTCIDIGERIERDILENQVAQYMERRLDNMAFAAAVAELSSRRILQCEGRFLRRIEPDGPEIELESSLENYLANGFTQHLKITAEDCVIDNTARRAAGGAGRWTRPDVTLAAIRRWRFDPRRQLDVFSFELKNRAGTTILAVHEALAHARFAHFPYLACPRPALESEVKRIRQECAEHGVGLIMFAVFYANETLHVNDFSHDLEAVRHSPDPTRVEEFLSKQLSQQAQERLTQIAWGRDNGKSNRGN